MHRWATVAVVALLAVSCSGGESGFAGWYARSESSRVAVAGAGTPRYSSADGLSEARSTCAILDQAAAGDLGARGELSDRMTNSLSGRFFIDATVRWVCPARQDTATMLVTLSSVDVRAKCSEDPSAVDCLAAGPDPLR